MKRTLEVIKEAYKNALPVNYPLSLAITTLPFLITYGLNRPLPGQQNHYKPYPPYDLTPYMSSNTLLSLKNLNKTS